MLYCIKITHNDDTLALQRDLVKLGLWADRWLTLFNPTKCYKMSSHRSRSPVWNSHVDKIAKKGNSILAFVKRNLCACSVETKRAAYVSLVMPHLEYVTA
ncbi:unnamed protein product, partial [Porites lobata]